MKSLRTRPFAAALVSVAMTVGVIAAAATPALAAYNPASPPYPVDSFNVANITIYDATTGALVTGGTNATTLDNYYFVASSAFSGTKTKAVVFGYLVEAGKDPQAFSGQGLGGATLYPATTAPAPVNTYNTPVAKGQSSSTFASLATTYPNTAPLTSDFYQLYQLRVKTTFPYPPSQTYAYADIKIDTTAGTWSQVSPSTPPAAAPVAPAKPAVTAGDASATVTVPVVSGATSYTVTGSPGGLTKTGAGPSFSFTGLTNGSPYTFTATATNATGTSAASPASDPVTPAAAPAPVAPAKPTATAGDMGATVTVPTVAGATSYTVTGSPGGLTKTGAGPTFSFTGLTNGTLYTFTATATNATGTSAVSPASDPVTPTAAVVMTVPGAPTGVTATGRDGGATVSFQVPASNGGRPISSYTVTASTGEVKTTSTTSVLFTGLANGTSRTFTVTATNAVGTGPRSNASNAVIFTTPTPTPTATAPRFTIAKHAILTGGTTTLTATGTAGDKVQVLARSFPATGYHITITLTLDGTGTAKLPIAYSRNTSLFVRNAKGSATPQSLVVVSVVSTNVKALGPQGVFYGHVTPAVGGRAIKIYYRVANGTHFYLVAQGVTNSMGDYRITHTFRANSKIVAYALRVTDGYNSGNLSAQKALTLGR